MFILQIAQCLAIFHSHGGPGFGYGPADETKSGIIGTTRGKVRTDGDQKLKRPRDRDVAKLAGKATNMSLLGSGE